MPHSTPSERFASSAFVEGHVCHLCHIAAASRRRGPPPLRFNAKRTEATGCVPHRAIRLYARWCSPRQETILRRWDFMHTLNQAWSSSLRVRRLSNNTPLPRTKSWRWPHRPRPFPPSHHSAAIATQKPRRSGRRRNEKEKNGSLIRIGEPCSRCTTIMVGVGTGGHVAHDPGRIGGELGSRSSRLLSPMRTHHLRNQRRIPCGCCKRLCAGEQRQQRKRRGWHGRGSRKRASFASSVAGAGRLETVGACKKLRLYPKTARTRARSRQAPRRRYWLSVGGCAGLPVFVPRVVGRIARRPAARGLLAMPRRHLARLFHGPGCHCRGG